MSVHDRIREVQKSILPERLRRGAAVLGQLWEKGIRCVDAWREGCNCTQTIGRTSFCEAKARWIGILRELHDGWPEGLTGREPFAMIEAMTISQFEKTGLTVLVEVPGARRPIKFGRRGTTWRTLSDLAVADSSVTVELVVNIQEMMET